jgi:hypothetical protein
MCGVTTRRELPWIAGRHLRATGGNRLLARARECLRNSQRRRFRFLRDAAPPKTPATPPSPCPREHPSTARRPASCQRECVSALSLQCRDSWRRTCFRSAACPPRNRAKLPTSLAIRGASLHRTISTTASTTPGERTAGITEPAPWAPTRFAREETSLSPRMHAFLSDDCARCPGTVTSHIRGAVQRSHLGASPRPCAIVTMDATPSIPAERNRARRGRPVSPTGSVTLTGEGSSAIELR